MHKSKYVNKNSTFLKKNKEKVSISPSPSPLTEIRVPHTEKREISKRGKAKMISLEKTSLILQNAEKQIKPINNKLTSL